jgi:hypothetical protein
MTTIRVTSMKEEELPSVSVIEPLSVSNEVVAIMEYRSYSQISTVTVRMEQPFSSAGAKSQFQKEQLQKEERTYS